MIVVKSTLNPPFYMFLLLEENKETPKKRGLSSWHLVWSAFKKGCTR